MRLLLAMLLACSTLPACGDPGGSGALDASDPLPPRDLALPPDGGSAIVFNVTDDETGQPIPARVLFTAISPTPALRFDRNAQGEPTGGATGTSPDPGIIGSPEGVLLVSGAARLALPIGTYDLFITHGPEWEAWTGRVTLTPTTPRTIDAPLRRSVDTTGWLAADLHVHTGRSFDSRLQLESRVVSEVSVGVELIVTTDHNVFTDLQPEVEQLGYASLSRAIVGDEFNFVEGHGGAYPIDYDPQQQDGGALAARLDWDQARLVYAGAMFDYLHGLPSRPAVTVNHPRLLPDLGYFINAGWAPPMPLADAGRFDAIEILGGYSQAPDDLAMLLRDWFFLLNTGTRVTGLGSSDTHRLSDVHAGFPRSWLQMPTERPEDVLPGDVAEAIRRGRGLASNGPFILLTVDGAQIGDLVENRSGRATAAVTVDAPAWIDVDTVRVFVNGKVAAERAVTPGNRPRFAESIALTLPSGDAWVAVQAGGATPLRADLIGEHHRGLVLPFAIITPVYIDGDGDGRFQPAFATLADADPGPIAPLSRNAPAPDALLDPAPPSPTGRDVPQDCEPPLWTIPSTWANP